jgi:hypothetical protein
MWQVLGVLTVFNLRRTSAHLVSVGVPCRRVPGPSVLLSVLNDKVLMAVTHQSVQFADIFVTMSESGTDSYTWGRAAPTRGPAVVIRAVRRREMAAGEGTGRAGRPPLM